LPENAHIIFATCILYNYLRDQGVGLSDMGSSANIRSSLTKTPNRGGSVHQSAFEVTDKVIHANIPPTQNTDHRTTNWRYQPSLRTRKYNRHPPVQPTTSPSLRSIRRTPSQLHSLQQIPTQHGKQNCPQSIQPNYL